MQQFQKPQSSVKFKVSSVTVQKLFKQHKVAYQRKINFVARQSFGEKIVRNPLSNPSLGTDGQENTEDEGDINIMTKADMQLRGMMEPKDRPATQDDFMEDPENYQKDLNRAMGMVTDEEYSLLLESGQINEVDQDLDSILKKYDPNVQTYLRKKLDEMDNRESYPSTQIHVATLYYLLSAVTHTKPHLYPPDVMNALPEMQYLEMSHTIITGMTYDLQEVSPGFIFLNDATGHWGTQMILTAIDNGAVAVFSTNDVPNIPDDLFYLVMEPDTLIDFAGAVYDVWSGSPSSNMDTVGVFGSYGKTTTSWLIRGMLEAIDHTTGMIGTIEYALAEHYLNHKGDFWEQPVMDKTAFRDCTAAFVASPYQGKYVTPQLFGTTPNYLQIQDLLSGMCERGAQSAVVECSAAGIIGQYTNNLHLKVAVFTNLYAEKDLGEFGRDEAIQLSIYDQFLKYHIEAAAVINIDDPVGDVLYQSLLERGKEDIIRISFQRQIAEVNVELVKYSVWDTEIIVRTPFGRLQIITPLIGKLNVYNILAAVAAGIALKIPLPQIVQGIEEVTIVPGRTEIIDEGQDFPVVVDSANTPDELLRLLDSMRSSGAGRIFLVLGCPGMGPEEGDETRQYRADMLQVAHHRADVVIVTNNNPRREDPKQIVFDMCMGLPEHIIEQANMEEEDTNLLRDVCDVEWFKEADIFEFQHKHRTHIIKDRFLAIRTAIGTAYQSGDMVLVVGKGHLDYQEYFSEEKDIIYRAWFDDRVECRNSLASLKYLKRIEPPVKKKGSTSTEAPQRRKRVYLDRRSIPWKTVTR